MAFDMIPADMFSGLPFMSETFWGNPLISYMQAAAVFIVVIAFLRAFRYGLLRNLHGLAKKTDTEVDDFMVRLIKSAGWPLYIIGGLYMAMNFIAIPEGASDVIYYALLILAIFYVLRTLDRVMDFSLGKVVERRRKKGQEVDTGIIEIIKKIINIIAWVAAFLFVISSLGYDISGAIVGLGVGGIVIGFALQNVLGDLFASFSIYFDRPFQKGDFIIIGEDLGTVEKVGLRSTKIRHLKGQQLIVPNSELSRIRINNYGKMEKRRVVFSFGVTYQTPSKKIEKVNGIVRDIIKKVDLADLDRVHFREFGNSALMFEVVYYVSSSDYNRYMDIQQEINLELKKRLEEEKIDFAYPTQTIFLEK
jgi:small-conductance mechanosensitive channel